MNSGNSSEKVDERFLKELDRLASLGDTDRDLLFREAMSRGLKDLSMDLAVKAFSERGATVSEAADIADVPVGDMMDELTERGRKSGIDEEDLKDCLENARRAIKG
jgi:predicted HTH domain antitoxin